MALKRTVTYRGKYGPVNSSSAKRFKSGRTMSIRKRPFSVPNRLGRPLIDGGVPPCIRTQLTYSSGVGYMGKTIAANTNTTFFFRGNGMFDPDAQVGGQQPLGFDQWAGLYRHYRVIGSKITVTLGHQEQLLIALNPMGAEALTHVFDAQNSTALPQSKYSLAHTSGGDMAGNIVLTNYCRADQLSGFNYDDDVLSAKVDADPNTPFYWCLTVCNGSTTTSYTYGFNVRITYFVEFFHPQALNMS